MQDERDIFDRLFSTRLLRPLAPFFGRHREPLLYLFFGALTTAVSWGSFYLLYYPLAIGELIANPLSWVAAVLFAFFTNRTWVFSSRGPLLRELLLFFAARLVTLALEQGIIFLFVTTLAYEAMAVKILGSIAVLLLNYVFSRLFVFKKKKDL